LRPVAVRRALRRRAGLLGGVALVALGVASAARSQEPLAAPASPPAQHAPAEQQQQPAPIPTETAPAQPAPAAEPPATPTPATAPTADQPPATQQPVADQPATPLAEIKITADKPTPKRPVANPRAAPVAASVAPRTRVVPTAPTTPAQPAATQGPTAAQAALDSKAHALDQARENLLPKLGATSYTITRQAIEEMPQGDNTPIDKLILQAPGVSYDSAVANPNFHIRSEYANVQYRINGVVLPEGVSGLGPVIDTNFVGSLTLLTGTLPAQYGLRTAGVVDITSRTFSVNTGNLNLYGGSRETSTPSFDYGGSFDNTQYFVTARGNWNNLGIENPTASLNAIHDKTEQGKFFGYTSTLIDDSTRFSLISAFSNSKFQIPNNPNQVPLGDFGPATYNSATLNENENDTYAFQLAALQTKADQFDSQLAVFARYAKVHFIPDIYGDLVFNDVASDVTRESYLYGTQYDAAYQLNDANKLRAGFAVSAEKTNVTNVSTVLPVDPITGAISPTPFTITDANSLLGWNIGTYIQDELKLTSNLTLNVGLRFDQLYQFVDANQFSPRAALVYKPAENTTVHIGYARYFRPPMQAQATQSNLTLFTNTTNQPDVPLNNPVLPERSNYFDIGVDQKVLPGLDVGFDVYYKMAKDLLDDGQFGQAVVLTQFNWGQGYSEGGEFKIKYRNGNYYAYGNLAFNRTRAVNPLSNQYLLNADEYAFLQSNYHYTDDTQELTGSAGMSYRWDQTLFTTNLIYGSGLRSGFANFDHAAPYAVVNLGVTREFQVMPGYLPLTARFDVVNLFDQIYQLRTGTGIGVFAPQYGARRGFYFGLSQKLGPGTEKPAAASTYTAAPAKTPAIFKARPEQAWTWAGYYLGANIGYSWGGSNTDAIFNDYAGSSLFGTSASANFSGIVGGAQTGYNWMFGRWLAGIEADIQYADRGPTPAFFCPGTVCNPFGPVSASIDQGYEVEWFATLRGRIGVAVTPEALLYVTGGPAFAEFVAGGTTSSFDATGAAAISPFYTLHTKVGWAAGAGAEAHISGPWAAKIEYLHMDFGTVSSTAINDLSSPLVNVNFNSHITDNIIKVGLNFKFSSVGTADAKY
jgi:outer membrane receptor protein involved in Fe transport/opacity protein-like surface antigen